MKEYNVYEDIAMRTNGDIYLGVVGPVRCGKSTFITEFMKKFVLPKITNKNEYQRAVDELPQSADGKTIMTTQPKFVPNEALKVNINDKLSFNVRLIDCVGYIIDDAMGIDENGKARMVKTPWSNKEMTFVDAAEFGTKKVITDHSSIGILFTTDGSFSDIPRDKYLVSEEKIANELRLSHKPYIIVVNSNNPNTENTKKLVNELENKYHAPCMALDAKNLKEDDVDKMFTKILNEFKLNSIKIKLPKWLQALEFSNPLISEIVDEVREATSNMVKIGDFSNDKILFEDSEHYLPINVSKINLGEGNVVIEIEPKNELFYEVLSKECNMEIQSEYELIKNLRELSFAKIEYDKIKEALKDVNEIGYGVVKPTFDQMSLNDPEIVKQGNKSGVKLKATAPSLHIMKVDIETEISPVVGTQQQSEDLVKYLLSEFENSPQGIWNTNIFGKSLKDLIQEGINNKINQTPIDVEKKLRKTLQRVINEGKGGVICILL